MSTRENIRLIARAPLSKNYKLVYLLVYVRSIEFVKALSHYNVLANVCRRMKYISSTLAYAEI